MIIFNNGSLSNVLGFQQSDTPGVDPPPSLLLDIMSDAIVAVSVRKIRTGYTGNCMKIRRFPENDTIDIGFDSNGNLDVAAIFDFVGSGSAYVDTWYGQQGGTDANLNFTQGTLAQQPRVADLFTNSTSYDSGVTKASVRFGIGGRDDRLTSGSISGTITNTHTIYLVAKRDDLTEEHAFYTTNGNLPVMKAPKSNALEYYVTNYTPGQDGQFFSNVGTGDLTNPFIFKLSVDGVNGFDSTLNKTRNQTATFTNANSFVPKTGIPLNLGYWFSSTKLLGNISEFILVPNVAYKDTEREDLINSYYGVY